MEHVDMVEKLHEKAGISLSEAKDALERSDWDMLEALLLLEREGKISPLTASATTTGSSEEYAAVVPTASPEKKKGRSKRSEQKDSEFEESMHRFSDQLKEFVLKGFTHDFVISRKGEKILCIPVFITVLIAIFAFYPILIALILGLFFDCSYTILRRSSSRDEANNDTENKQS